MSDQNIEASSEAAARGNASRQETLGSVRKANEARELPTSIWPLQIANAMGDPGV
jgi:hypothetical protein